jgi:hypothetical protein
MTFRQMLLARAILFTSFVAICPMLFITFDAHHDGLVLATIRMTRNSLESGMPLPFNQYGPSWSLLFTFFTWFSPFQYLMISLRVLTLVVYLMTGYLIFYISKKFFSQRTAYLATLIFALSQPFTSIYQSGFMSWPSIFASPFILLLIFFINRRTLAVNESNKLLFDSSIVILLILLIFSRAQVGLLALVFVVAYFLIYLKIKDLAVFGFLFLITTVILVLTSLNIELFKYSFLDTFSYGALKASRGLGFSTPVMSIIGAFLWLILFYLLKRRGTIGFEFERKLLPVLALGFFTFVVMVMLLADRQNLELFGLFSTLQRRLWVSLFLFSFSLIAIVFLKKVYRILLKDASLDDRKFLVFGFSIVGFAQIYPLFDQMHSWWGAAPLVISMAYYLDVYFSKSRVIVFHTTLVLCTLALFFNVGLSLASLDRSRSAFPSEQLTFIQDSPEIQQSFSSTNDFLRENLPAGSTVQNLCPDANVFLLPENFASTTYLTVFWNNFENTPHIAPQLKSYENTYIVDCLGIVKSDPELFGISPSSISLISKYLDAQKRIWNIYLYQ